MSVGDLSLATLPLNVFNDLKRSLLDSLNVLPMRVRLKLLGGTNNEIDAIDACLNSNTGVIHITPHI